MEHYQPVPYDFYSLAYLTSASTVHDAPGLRDWAGAGPEREKLVAMWRELTDGAQRGAAAFGDSAASSRVPKDRLLNLIKQAAAWQVTAASPKATGPINIETLFVDYTSPAIPTRLKLMVRGHKANVKCVDFVGETMGVSGSR